VKRKKRMRFEKIMVIVREHNDMPGDFPATVAVKYTINGKQYGLFNGFNKPELTVPEVVETVNSLLQDIIGAKMKGGAE